MKARFLFLILLWLLIANPLYAATYYVDTTGTDDGSCGKAAGASACATLSYIVATRGLAGAGDTIEIAAGSYTDNTAMSVPVGVHIHGAGSGTTTITTNQSAYIKTQSNVPTVDGSNDISGFNLTASGALNIGILSSGRNNQKFHDMIFTGYSVQFGGYGGLAVYGKYGRDDAGTGFYDSSCSGGEPTTTWCSGVKGVHTAPASTDWATGIEVYNNTFTNSRLGINVLKGALIHDNTFDNDNGTDVSAIGNTSYWSSGVQIYSNTINMNKLTTSVYAIELFGFGEDVSVYNNTISGLVSFTDGDLGKGATSYSAEIYSNTFYVSKAMTGASVPYVEFNAANADIADVRIFGNYFASSATDRGAEQAISAWAQAMTLSNVLIAYNVFGVQYYSTLRQVIDLADLGAGTVNNVYVYNNTFDVGANKTPGLIEHSSSGVVTNSYWRNNIINGGYYGIALNGTAGFTGHTADHNFLYNVPFNFRALGAARLTQSSNVMTNDTPATIQVGDRSDYTGTTDLALDSIFCMPYKALYSGTLGYAHIKKSGTNADTAKVAVYLDDNSGDSTGPTPTAGDTLVAVSAEISTSTAGWNTSSAPLGGSITQGNVYWVCTLAGAGSWNRMYSTTGTRRLFNQTGYTGSYAAPPATLTGTWNDSGGNNRDDSVYVEIDSPVINSSAPGFVGSGDKPAPYYTLRPSSPAINAGVDVGLTQDYSGVPVPQRGVPDIGAYEFPNPDTHTNPFPSPFGGHQ